MSSHIILLLCNYIHIHRALTSNVAIVLKSVSCGWQYQLNYSLRINIIVCVNVQHGMFFHMLFRLLYNYVYIHQVWTSSSAIILKSVTCSWHYQLNNSFELLSLCLLMDNLICLHILFCCCDNYVRIHRALTSNVAIVLKSVTCGWQYQLNNSLELISLCVLMNNLVCFFTCYFVCCITMYTYIKSEKAA